MMIAYLKSLGGRLFLRTETERDLAEELRAHIELALREI